METLLKAQAISIPLFLTVAYAPGNVLGLVHLSLTDFVIMIGFHF